MEEEITMKREDLIREMQDGSVIGVTFQKKSGEIRKMQCRAGVKKHLKGGSKSYSDEDKGLVTVYSFDSKGYRSIPVDRILEVRSHGRILKPKG